MSRKLNRRTFLERLGGVTAATLTTSVVGVSSFARTHAEAAPAAGMEGGDTHDRRWQAYRLRHDAALAHSTQPFPVFPTNGDEDAYPTRIASYTKGLPHNARGEVDSRRILPCSKP